MTQAAGSPVTVDPPLLRPVEATRAAERTEVTISAPATTDESLVRLRLDISYDGTQFSGWAAQPDRRTVAGCLLQALEVLFRRPVPLVVAGRTDAGVHAARSSRAHRRPAGRVTGARAAAPHSPAARLPNAGSHRLWKRRFWIRRAVGARDCCADWPGCCRPTSGCGESPGATGFRRQILRPASALPISDRRGGMGRRTVAAQRCSRQAPSTGRGRDVAGRCCPDRFARLCRVLQTPRGCHHDPRTAGPDGQRPRR